MRHLMRHLMRHMLWVVVQVGDLVMTTSYMEQLYTPLTWLVQLYIVYAPYLACIRPLLGWSSLTLNP
jgi:hypothetical protein